MLRQPPSGIRTATPEETVAIGLRASGPANLEEAVATGHRASGPANSEEAVATGHRASGPTNSEEAVAIGHRASGPTARPTSFRQERAPISNAVSDERYGCSFYLSAYLIRIRTCPKFRLLRPHPARPLLTFLSPRFRRFLPHSLFPTRPGFTLPRTSAPFPPLPIPREPRIFIHLFVARPPDTPPFPPRPPTKKGVSTSP